MKGIIIALFCFVQLMSGTEAKAGIGNGPDTVASESFTNDSIPHNEQMRYNQLLWQFKNSIPICLPVGVGLGILGLKMLDHKDPTNDAQIIPGLFVLVSGIVVAFVLPPVLVASAHHRLRTLKAKYPGISVKPTSKGVGLTLVF